MFFVLLASKLFCNVLMNFERQSGLKCVSGSSNNKIADLFFNIKQIPSVCKNCCSPSDKFFIKR